MMASPTKTCLLVRCRAFAVALTSALLTPTFSAPFSSIVLLRFFLLANGNGLPAPFPPRVSPNFVVSGDGLFAYQIITQLSNTVPTAIYGDYDFVGVDFSATLSVNDNNFDDDYIGFIFELSTNPACMWRSGRSVTSHL